MLHILFTAETDEIRKPGGNQEETRRKTMRNQEETCEETLEET